MQIVKVCIKNIQYWLRIFLGSNKLLFVFLSLHPRLKQSLISRSTEICIEGFPRSANSFFTTSFQLINPEVRCAHHVHVPMQVIRAVEFNIPCIVLIRNPLDAIASVLVADRNLSPELALQSYIDFYQNIWQFRAKVVVSEFNQTIQDVKQVILSVNSHYNCAFNAQDLTPSMKDEVFFRIKEVNKALKQPSSLVAIPTEAKNKLKQEVITELKQHPKLVEAESIYKKFLQN